MENLPLLPELIRSNGKPQDTASCSLDSTAITAAFHLESPTSLFLGDCLAFLGTIPDESVQLVVTSPPYNIGKEYEQSLDIEVYIEQQRAVIDECVRVLGPSGSICWQIGNYVDRGEIIPLDVLLYGCFKDNGMKMRNRIIWHFGHGLHCSNRFSGRYETMVPLQEQGQLV